MKGKISSLFDERIKRAMPDVNAKMEDYVEAKRAVEGWQEVADTLWQRMISDVRSLIVQAWREAAPCDRAAFFQSIRRWLESNGFVTASWGTLLGVAELADEKHITRLADIVASAFIGGLTAMSLRKPLEDVGVEEGE